ncbi:hypothetical protein ABZ725_43615 [Streptomyces sp. NPDC006872]|uniref:hypothetical protein n=1 Tax=Streptomyces sp. NPDC006872 TaxID=3155720 RepID=UPI0033F4C8AD
MDSRPNPVPRSGTATIEKAGILGLQPEVQVNNALNAGRLAPFTEDSWHVRIGRVANWAGVLRLAARAGEWELRPVVGHSPPHPAGMAELLSGIYAIGEQGEIWMAQLRERRLPPANEIAKAEGFLTGPGSIEDLELFFYD